MLAGLFIARGIPARIRSDQGPEFVAGAVKGWIGGVGAATACIEKGSPWETGYVESFNTRLRDELLDGDRAVEAALQREAPALITGLSPAGPRGHAVRAADHAKDIDDVV
jgi:transposase InsO family protein